jgi:hypothetical protein
MKIKCYLNETGNTLWMNMRKRKETVARMKKLEEMKNS